MLEKLLIKINKKKRFFIIISIITVLFQYTYAEIKENIVITAFEQNSREINHNDILEEITKAYIYLDDLENAKAYYKKIPDENKIALICHFIILNKYSKYQKYSYFFEDILKNANFIVAQTNLFYISPPPLKRTILKRVRQLLSNQIKRLKLIFYKTETIEYEESLSNVLELYIFLKEIKNKSININEAEDILKQIFLSEDNEIVKLSIYLSTSIKKEDSKNLKIFNRLLLKFKNSNNPGGMINELIGSKDLDLLKIATEYFLKHTPTFFYNHPGLINIFPNLFYKSMISNKTNKPLKDLSDLEFQILCKVLIKSGNADQFNRFFKNINSYKSKAIIYKKMLYLNSILADSIEKSYLEIFNVDNKSLIQKKLQFNEHLLKEYNCFMGSSPANFDSINKFDFYIKKHIESCKQNNFVSLSLIKFLININKISDAKTLIPYLNKKYFDNIFGVYCISEALLFNSEKKEAFALADNRLNTLFLLLLNSKYESMKYILTRNLKTYNKKMRLIFSEFSKIKGYTNLEEGIYHWPIEIIYSSILWDYLRAVKTLQVKKSYQNLIFD